MSSRIPITAAWIVLLVLSAVLYATPTLSSAQTPPPAPSTSRPDTSDWQIAFISSPVYPYNPNLYLLDVRSGKVTPLTDNMKDGYENYRSLSWSPDGKQLAYTVWKDRARGHAIFGGYEINVRDLETGTVRQLGGGLSDYYVSWSPDGKQLAFISFRRSERGDDYGIFVMDADGKNQKVLARVSRNEGYLWALTWSPRGDKIVYLLDDDASCPRLYVINADGTHPRKFPDAEACFGPSLSWSPAGDYIAIVKDGQIYLVDADNTRARPITKLPGLPDFLCGEPIWSPDGKQIAFMTYDGRRNTALHLTSLDGTIVRIMLRNDDSNEPIQYGAMATRPR